MTEKLLLIRSLGFIVPQSAIVTAAVCSRDETTYEMPMTELSAMPNVVVRKTKSYFLYLQLKPENVPADPSAEEEDTEVEEEEVVEEKPRRGRRKKVVEEPVVEEVPALQSFLIPLHEDILDTVEMPLNLTDAVRNFIVSEEGYKELEKKLRFLGKYFMEYNNSIENIAPQIPFASDLLPADLARDVQRTTASGVEEHANQMRAASEVARRKYDAKINWFRDKVLVPTQGEREYLNITSDVPEKSDDGLTQSILIAMIKAEMTPIL